MNHNVRLEWTPNVGLGPVALGTNIEEIVGALSAQVDETVSKDSDWDSYIVPGLDLALDVENDTVVSITGYDRFIYKGHNLIGISIIELGQILGCLADEIGELVEFDDGDSKRSYDYMNLGLQIWASRGIVTSATCLTYNGATHTQ